MMILEMLFEKQSLELLELFQGVLRKRTQGACDKVMSTKLLAYLKFLSKPSYPDHSEEIRKHHERKAFSVRLLDENVRLENKKVTRMSLAEASKAIYI